MRWDRAAQQSVHRLLSRLRVHQAAQPIQINCENSMADFPYRCALILGAGPGISASLARRLSKIGLQVGLAARDVEKLKPLAEETAAAVFAVDASQPEEVAKLFLDMERQVAEPDIVIYNASSRVARSALERRSRRGRESDRYNRVRRVLGRPAGREANGAKRAWSDLLYRRERRHEGFRPIGGFRDGQVRTARARSERRKRARPEGDTRRALQHRRRRPLIAPTGPERSA